VPADLKRVKEFFGLANWPNGMARIDLEDRIVDVIPAPAHQSAHVVFYDERTGILFSGDFLMPGRLIVEDTAAYRESAKRVAKFAQNLAMTHVLSGHIEMDAAGQLYPHGSTAHPNGRPLELSKEYLLSLPSALDAFNGFYARYPHFVITHPIHNVIGLASLTLV
jgi:glyoxylase-like metal-dependent hydrolase (beta-lactamase superfamily II)